MPTNLLQLADGNLIEVFADPAIFSGHSWRLVRDPAVAPGTAFAVGLTYVVTDINTAAADETPNVIIVTLEQLASAGSVEALIATHPEGWAGLQV